MAIDFPDSPSNNDIYTVNGKRWIYSSGKWSIYGTTSPDATASDTEPTGVGDGHIWYRSDQSQTLIRYDNTWVEVGSAGGFDNASTNFPTSLDSATGFAAVEALQAKVGVDSSAVTSSLDYKVAQLEAVSHGKILQVVSTTKTDTFSASVATGAVSGAAISASITPTSATSKVFILAQISTDNSATNGGDAVIYRGGSILSGAAGDSAGSRRSSTSGSSPVSGDGRIMPTIPLMFLDSPATTSATTYDVRLGHASATTQTVYLNRSSANPDSAAASRPISSITLVEVSA